MRAACHALSACSTFLAVHPSSPPHPPSHCPQCGNTNVNLAKSFFWDQASATWPCHLPTTHLSRTPTTQRPHAHFPLTSLPPSASRLLVRRMRRVQPVELPRGLPPQAGRRRHRIPGRLLLRELVHEPPRLTQCPLPPPLSALLSAHAPLSALVPSARSLTARALRTLSCACRRCNEHTTASPMCEGCVSTRRALEEKKEKVKPTLLHAPSS